MEEQKSSWQVSAEMINANCTTIRNIMCIKEYIFYAITNTILVYDYKDHKVMNCLNGHKGRINNIALLDTDDSTSIVSVDTDKTIIVWTSTDVKSLNWHKTVYEHAHTAEINNVTATRFNSDLYFTTFCLDGDVKVWKSHGQDTIQSFDMIGQLHFGKNLQETFKMFPVNDRYIMLLTGGFDKNVHVYTVDTNDTKGEPIEYHTSLTGHSNSIRDYCVTEAYENDLRYIFSSSQD